MADIKMNTPTGVAVHPWLKVPDTKYNPLGEFKTGLLFPLEDVKPLMDKLTEIFKRHTGKAPNTANNTMWIKEVDDDTGEETGNVMLKFKAKNVRNKATGEVWNRRPVLFDASLKPIDVNPWGGSEMRISFTLYEWANKDGKGVTLQPQAIQIINLVEGGGSVDGGSFGFGQEEGGYIAPESSGFDDDDVAEVPVEDDAGDF